VYLLPANAGAAFYTIGRRTERRKTGLTGACKRLNRKSSFFKRYEALGGSPGFGKVQCYSFVSPLVLYDFSKKGEVEKGQLKTYKNVQLFSSATFLPTTCYRQPFYLTDKFLVN
jgi:hypothetical protein